MTLSPLGVTQGWGVSIVEFAESEAQVPMEPWRVAWMREMRARDWLNDCQCNNVLAIGCPVHIIDGPTLCAENHDFDPTDYGPQVAAAILLVVHRGDMWGWGGEVGSRILPSVCEPQLELSTRHGGRRVCHLELLLPQVAPGTAAAQGLKDEDKKTVASSAGETKTAASSTDEPKTTASSTETAASCTGKAEVATSTDRAEDASSTDQSGKVINGWKKGLEKFV